MFMGGESQANKIKPFFLRVMFSGGNKNFI